jgi:hypothetical protein
MGQPESGVGEAEAEEILAPETVSTINSQKSILVRPTINLQKAQALSSNYPDSHAAELRERYDKLKAENTRLWEELIGSEQTVQRLLKSSLSEKKLQIQQMQTEVGGRRASITSPPTPSIVIESELTGDATLIAWLRNLSFDHETIRKFAAETYTLEDVLRDLTRDDLKALRLRGGVELRLWRIICSHRNTNVNDNKNNNSDHGDAASG